MKRYFLLVVSLLIMFVGVAMAQSTVTGVVMAEGEPDPVIGANVVLKGTTSGTITDFDGNFSIEAKAGDVLIFSYLGYKTQEVKVANPAAPIKVTLVSDNVMLDEVVAIGYGAMKKSDLTGAVTSVKADELTKAPVSGLDQALQGRAAGVTVTTNSGQPGEAATIRIRGIGSAIGGNDPLYVVDGVITSNISFLAPNDIQSMEILKDASATAIYGSRGANGVIIVTTKTGSQGGAKPNISFDAYWGFQNRWKKLDLMDSYDMAETKLRMAIMKDSKPAVDAYVQYHSPVEEGGGLTNWMRSRATSSYFPNNADYTYDRNTDWQDEVFNKNAFMHNYNLSMDGGSDKGHYAFSANYFSQEGTIIGSNYERLTLRLNSDYQVRKWLKFGEHLSFMFAQGRNAMNNSDSPGASVISAALAMAPWDPTYYPEGSTYTDKTTGEVTDLSGRVAASSNFKNVTNPFSMVYESYPLSKDERLVGDIYLEMQPVKGLTIRPSISMDYNINQYRLYKNAYDYSTYDKSLNNFLERSMSRSSTLLEETTITYANEIGKHNFSVMVGQTWQESNCYSLGGSGIDILSPTPEHWYLSNTTTPQDKLTKTSDNVSRERRLSFLGRAFYSYDNRYMATVNFRADGSSKFTKNPWGFFPSVALAWRVSEEPFIRDNEVVWLDNLKVRAGWGQVGNDGVGSSSFVKTMGFSSNVFYGYPLGLNGQYMQEGAAVLTLPDLNGKWETNEQWDAGIDFSFWNGKLSGSVDYFLRDTKDALLYVNAPAHVGNRYPLVRNVGVIRNQGVEIALDHSHKVNKFSYSIGGNISWIKNELRSLNGGSPLYENGTLLKTDVGMPLRSFWGYQYEGIYQTNEEAAYFTNQNMHAGDAKFADLNGEHQLTNEDYTYIGNPFPKVTYGLNFTAEFYGVDIQLFFQGVAGNQIYNALRKRTEGSGDECTLGSQMKDVWIGYDNEQVQNYFAKFGMDYTEYENRTGTIPNPMGSTQNSANSSRFVEDGSYFRLKNAQIGYTLPKKVTEKFKCSRLRFYATASNLFTLTKYSGYDPEVGGGVDYGNYPQSRTFTFGLNANF